MRQIATTQKLEALLFISNKPLSCKKLAELLEVELEAVKDSAELLKEKYAAAGGVRLLDNGHSLQLATSPAAGDVVEAFLKQELTGEMTRPQLETLTIVAYRGPILKAELEQIRGVNCSLILRNLLIRGLVETVTDEDKITRYQITMDFLRFLGVTAQHELPDYDKLAQHHFIDSLLQQQAENPAVIAEEGGEE
jgi:segregation and condensation protein B